MSKLKTMQFKRAAVKLINVKNALLAGLTLLAGNCYADGDPLTGAFDSVKSAFGQNSNIYAIAIVAEAVSAFFLYHKSKEWKSLLFPAIAIIATTVFWTIAPSPGG